MLGGRERGTRRSHPCRVTQNLPAVWVLRQCSRKESDRHRGPGATPCPESVSSEDQLLPAGRARCGVSMGCSRRKERGMHRLWGCHGFRCQVMLMVGGLLWKVEGQGVRCR